MMLFDFLWRDCVQHCFGSCDKISNGYLTSLFRRMYGFLSRNISHSLLSIQFNVSVNLVSGNNFCEVSDRASNNTVRRMSYTEYSNGRIDVAIILLRQSGTLTFGCNPE